MVQIPADERAEIALAFGLAAVAGWVDVTTYLHFNGLFVSFMSGNTTAFASAIGFDATLAGHMARAIGVFVLGVTIGEIAGGLNRRWERVSVLSLVTLFLGAALACELLHLPVSLGLICLGLAMGMENACLHKVGRISLSLTYVTGVLVNVGRNFASLMRGENIFPQFTIYGGLWLSLLVGSVLGSVTSRHSFALAEAIAAAVTAGLALLSMLQLRFDATKASR